MIIGRMTIEGAPHLRDEHYAVFDCANRCGSTGQRFLAPMAHVRMMAAAQPFLSGAISKTVNLPNEATVDDVAEHLRGGLEARPQGRRALPRRLQGLASRSRPTRTSDEATREKETRRCQGRDQPPQPSGAAVKTTPSMRAPHVDEGARPPATVRHRLPKKRRGFTQEARVGGHKVFLRTGEYEDGTLGEIFIDMHKEGAAFRSLMNCFAMACRSACSTACRSRRYVEQFTFTRFEPHGRRRGSPEHQVRDLDRRLHLPRARASST